MNVSYILYMLIIMALLTESAPAFANSFDQEYIKFQNMKQVKIYDRDIKIPSFLVSEPPTKRFVLNKIIFEKNEAFTSDDLAQIVNPKIGTKVSKEDLSQLKEALKETYKKYGYKSTIINIKSTNEIGSIVFSIYEGPKSQTAQLTDSD